MVRSIATALCLITLACGNGGSGRPADAGADGPPAATGWRVVPFEPLPARPVLGINGLGNRVYFAGGSIGTGKGALALQFDGRWSELPIEVEETLWWVWPRAADDVWFVGERGIAVRWDGRSATVHRVATDATLFGVWGCAADQVWAVGGSPASMGDNDVLARWDGTAWTRVDPPEALGVSYLKVWGSGCDDVYVVGRQGVIVRWDGTRWTRMQSNTQASLVTVAGSGPRDVYAVGGPPATVMHWDGAQWTSLGDFGWKSAAVSGVHVQADGTAWLVGWGGETWRRSGGRLVDDTQEALVDDLHVVWSDGAGNAFAGGGTFLAPGSPTLVRRGVIARYGSAVPDGTVSRP